MLRKVCYTVCFNGHCGEAYSIAEVETDILLKEIIEYIAKLSGRKVVYDLPTETEQKGFFKVTVEIINSSKLQKLGWKPFENLESGIKKTIDITIERCPRNRESIRII